MTVKELINALLAFDPDAIVVVPDIEGTDDDDESSWAGIRDVRYVSEARFYDVWNDGVSGGYKTANVVRLEGF